VKGFNIGSTSLSFSERFTEKAKTRIEDKDVCAIGNTHLSFSKRFMPKSETGMFAPPLRHDGSSARASSTGGAGRGLLRWKASP
jgi:hypothetical protein